MEGFASLCNALVASGHGGMVNVREIIGSDTKLLHINF